MSLQGIEIKESYFEVLFNKKTIDFLHSLISVCSRYQFLDINATERVNVSLKNLP